MRETLQQVRKKSCTRPVCQFKCHVQTKGLGAHRPGWPAGIISRVARFKDTHRQSLKAFYKQHFLSQGNSFICAEWHAAEFVQLPGYFNLFPVNPKCVTQSQRVMFRSVWKIFLLLFILSYFIHLRVEFVLSGQLLCQHFNTANVEMSLGKNNKNYLLKNGLRNKQVNTRVGSIC